MSHGKVTNQPAGGFLDRSAGDVEKKIAASGPILKKRIRKRWDDEKYTLYFE
jgi:hypothetical protein